MKQKLRIGVGLDGCLSDTQSHFEKWRDRTGSDADSFLHPSFVRDESFWRALSAYDDVKSALRRLTEASVEVYVLTERPVRLVPITAAWLRHAGLAALTNDHVVPLSIKRYDSRLLGLSVLFDSDLEALKSFVYDDTDPWYIDRMGDGGSLNGRIRNYDYLDEAVNEFCADYML